MYNRLGGNRLALTRSFAQNLLGKPAPNPGQLDPEAVRITVFWYRHHMRRDPNQAELTAWVNRLGAGASPFDAHAELLAGDKYFAIQNGNVDAMIAAMYRETVSRRPSPEEIAYWRSVLQPTGNRVALTRAFLRWAEMPNNDGGQLNAPTAGPANGVAELMLQLASLIQQNSRDELANTPQGRRLQTRTEDLIKVCEGYRQEVTAIGNARVDPWTALLNVEQSLQGVIDELNRPANTAPRTATLIRQMTQLAPVWRETLGTAVRPPMRLPPIRPFGQ